MMKLQTLMCMTMGKVVLKDGEWCKLLRKDEAEKLIRAYIEDENYTVYYTEQK